MNIAKNASNYEFSLILPFQDDAQYVEECLNSISSQQHGNIEVICINLNSSDTTSKIINKYAKKKYYIKVIKDIKATNINQAYNLGLRLAHGKYVKFINARMTFYKFSFALLFNMMKFEQTYFAVHSQSYLWPGGYSSDTSYDWIKNTPAPASIYAILPHCLQNLDFWNSVAFNRQFALECNIVFDENLFFVDESKLFKMMFLSQNISLVYQNIVKNNIECMPCIADNIQIDTQVEILTENMYSAFDKYCKLPIYKSRLADYLLRQYARCYKITPILRRDILLSTINDKIHRFCLSSEDLNNLSEAEKFNYGCFLTRKTYIGVSIVLICQSINNFVKQYVSNFFKLNNLFAELLIYTETDDRDKDLDNLCNVCDFINISYGTNITDSILKSARGKYILFQSENDFFLDNLWEFWAYAVENNADILFGIQECDTYTKNTSAQISQEYLKYIVPAFTYLNIYANKFLDLLYHESAQLYNKEYLLQQINNTDIMQIPLIAALNSKKLVMYDKRIKINKTHILSDSQKHTLYQTFFSYTSAKISDRINYDLLLYRFRVASQQDFIQKLTDLENKYRHNLEEYKISIDTKTQESFDRFDVENSPLWDENFYLSQFNYSRYNIQVSPVEHYIRKGWKKGYSPSPYFNGPQYGEHYEIKKQNPLAYFIQKGRFCYKGFLENPYKPSADAIKKYWDNKKKNRKVVYMCITGDYDKLEDIAGHSYINPDWDYICFTDNKQHLKKKIVGIWQIRKLVYNQLDNTRNNRWHKVFPHVLLSEYDESIYMDSNINVLTPFLYEEIERRNVDLLLPKHAGNFSIYHEYKWALSTLLDKPELIMGACEEIMNTGFPFFYGMPECNIIYRRHNSEMVKKIMDEWWYWIKTYAKRDQLSFSYLLWKNHLNISQCTFVNARIDYKDFCVFAHPADRKK